MAAMVASSPAAHFRSPLRNFRAEACDRAATAEVYADAQSQLMQWRKDLLSAAAMEAQQGLRELSHEREHLNDLRSDLQSVKSLVQVASQLQTGGVRLAEVLQSSSDASEVRAQAIARITDDLQESCERRQQELRQEEHNIEQQAKVAEAQHTEALKMLTTYKDRLGLSITREAPQTVQMSFSMIDQADTEKEFYFTLGLAACKEDIGECYGVDACVPSVPQLQHLLQELNNNARSATALPRFVCSMRRAFIELAKRE